MLTKTEQRGNVSVPKSKQVCYQRNLVFFQVREAIVAAKCFYSPKNLLELAETFSFEFSVGFVVQISIFENIDNQNSRGRKKQQSWS